VTSPSADRRTAPLLVRLSPSERTDLDRVRREMGLRSAAEAVRALFRVWDGLTSTQRKRHAQTTKAPAEAGASSSATAAGPTSPAPKRAT
jgi:hypothetical protein